VQQFAVCKQHNSTANNNACSQFHVTIKQYCTAAYGTANKELLGKRVCKIPISVRAYVHAGARVPVFSVPPYVFSVPPYVCSVCPYMCSVCPHMCSVCPHMCVQYAPISVQCAPICVQCASICVFSVPPYVFSVPPYVQKPTSVQFPDTPNPLLNVALPQHKPHCCGLHTNVLG
jgi:hypothetical protein